MTPWEYIVERIKVEDTGHSTPCWLWQKCLTEKGYARACVPTYGGMVRVHRVTYELIFGPIPTNLQPDHLCRIPSCVNPAHIELVTPRENTLRGNGPTAINARKSHCANGHEFTPDNTRTYRGGQRWCLTCRPWGKANLAAGSSCGPGEEAAPSGAARFGNHIRHSTRPSHSDWQLIK